MKSFLPPVVLKAITWLCGALHWKPVGRRQANHILISPVEHHAVSRTAQQLAVLQDFEVEFLPVDSFGMVYPESVAERIRPDTALVSVMYANNEIGTINPIAEIGEVCHSAGIPFHTDAVQAAAYLPINVNSLNVDLLSIGAHKFYGPKGVGALYVRKGVPILPVQTGGSQEFGFRAGTHNIPYIVGLAKALNLTQEERDQRIDLIMPLTRSFDWSNPGRNTGLSIERTSNPATTQPCQFCISWRRWEFTAHLFRYRRFCVFIWLSMQNWQSRTFRCPPGAWIDSGMGLGLFAGNIRTCNFTSGY